MIDRKKHVPNFSFEFRDDDRLLDALFWVDETFKMHYKEFGDPVSFDATFRTNRYDMVFVPFTGIDNHKRSVTFRGGLLSRENDESYVWLLEAFLREFGKAPIIVMLDQDPTMKKAIERVFHDSYHRLCMWHITSKLKAKVSWEIYNNSAFKRRFNYLIWNSKEEIESEEGWNSLMDDFNLNDNKWFKDMFRLRSLWILAFFKNVSLSGLMRSTSRFESENSSFKKSTNSGTTLVNFMIAFETSMEKQMHFQSVLDFKDIDKFPKLRTELEIEANAAKHYTRKVFRQVQNEIHHSMMSCYQTSRVCDDVVVIVIISEAKTITSSNINDTTEEGENDNESDWDQNLKDTEFEVKFNRKEDSWCCSCLNFEHVGILCRHIFCVMRYHKINHIPPKYILRRWRQNIISTEMLRKNLCYGAIDHETDMITIDLFSSVDRTIYAISTDKDKMEEFLSCLKELENKFVDDQLQIHQSTQNSEFFRVLRLSAPSVVVIHNSYGIRNKGCGTRKRLKSSKEITVDKA